MFTYQKLEKSIQENTQLLLTVFDTPLEKEHIKNLLNETEVKIVKSYEEEKENLKKLKLDKFKLTLSKPIAWLRGEKEQYQEKQNKLAHNIRAIKDQGVDSVSDLKHIYLSIESLNEFMKNEFKHLNDKEMIDFIYFHELGHLLQHANIKIDSFYNNLPASFQSLLDIENKDSKSTQIFLLSSDHSEKLKYNLTSSFLLEHLLNDKIMKTSSEDFPSTIKDVLKRGIDECFADTYAVLCQTKKDGRLNQHIQNVMTIRKNSLETPDNMLHFTYYGISQIKEIMKQKEIQIESLTLENIQNIAKEVANIAIHKNLYTLIKQFDSVKKAMEDSLFKIVKENKHPDIQLDLILGKEYQQKDKYQLFETYEKYLMKKIGFSWAVQLNQEIKNNITNKVIKIATVEVNPELFKSEKNNHHSFKA